LLEQSLRSGSELVRQARVFARDLSLACAARCAEAAQASAEAFEDVLVELDAACERGAGEARDLARYVALERDRLESIVAVLALRGDTSALRGALDRLDEQASLFLGQLSSSGVRHALLERTAEVEPFAWWGAITVP
jgi:hypothetical protein